MPKAHLQHNEQKLKMVDELYKLINEFKTISIKTIHRELHVNPANEEDRRKVWAIGQALAGLYRLKWVDMGTATGQRVFYTI